MGMLVILHSPRHCAACSPLCHSMDSPSWCRRLVVSHLSSIAAAVLRRPASPLIGSLAADACTPSVSRRPDSGSNETPQRPASGPAVSPQNHFPSSWILRHTCLCTGPTRQPGASNTGRRLLSALAANGCLGARDRRPPPRKLALARHRPLAVTSEPASATRRSASSLILTSTPI